MLVHGSDNPKGTLFQDFDQAPALLLSAELGSIPLFNDNVSESTESSTSFLMLLPNEVIAEVFIHVIVDYDTDRGLTVSGTWTQVMQVCRRFHSIACDFSRLWSYIDLTWSKDQVAHYMRLSKNLPLNLCGIIAVDDCGLGNSIISKAEIFRTSNSDLFRRSWKSLTISLRGASYSSSWPTSLDTIITTDFVTENDVSQLLDFHWRGNSELFMRIDHQFLGGICPRLTMLHMDCIRLESHPQLPVLEKLVLHHVWYESISALCRFLGGSPHLHTLVLQHVQGSPVNGMDDMVLIEEMPTLALPNLAHLTLSTTTQEMMDLMRVIPLPRMEIDFREQAWPLYSVDEATASTVVPEIDLVGFMLSAMQVVPSISWNSKPYLYHLVFDQELSAQLCTVPRELSLNGVVLSSRCPDFPALESLALQNIRTATLDDFYNLLRTATSLRALIVDTITLTNGEPVEIRCNAIEDKHNLPFSQLERINIRATLPVMKDILHHLPLPLLDITLEELGPRTIWQQDGGAYAFDEVLSVLREFWTLRVGQDLPLCWKVCDYGYEREDEDGDTTFMPRRLGQWNATMFCQAKETSKPTTITYTRHRITNVEPLRGYFCSLDIRISKFSRSDVRKIIFNLMKSHAQHLQQIAVYGTTEDESCDQEAVRFLRVMLCDLKEITGKPLDSLQWDCSTETLRPYFDALVHDDLVINLSTCNS